MGLALTDDICVLAGPDELAPLLEAPASTRPIAVWTGEAWVLLQPFDVWQLRMAVAAGENLRDVLVRWPRTPVGSRETEPPAPSLVMDEGRVVAAWAPVGPLAARPSVPPRGGSSGSDTKHGPSHPQPGRRGVRRGGPPKAEPAPPGEATRERTLRRTPHLDAPELIPKAAGTEFRVSVYTDTEQLRPGEGGRDVVVTLPAGVDRVEVGVLLQVTPHFEVVTKQYGDLTIEGGKPRSEPLEFRLRVARDAPRNRAGIGVLFTYRGRSCGYVARSWAWDGPEADAPGVPADPASATTMPVHVGAERPDLSVYVTAPVRDGRRYLCAVDTPLIEGYTNATSSSEFAVPAEADSYLKRLLDAVVDAGKTPDQRLRALTEVGHEAFEAAPDNFKQVLWAMVDSGRLPETIYVASSEPTLPWELMIPRRFDGKEPKKLGPLGTEFSIGRWTRGDCASPPPELPVTGSFVVAPVYESEHRRLSFKDEVAFVESRLRGKRIEPATVKALDVRFKHDHASLLHFVCHGAAGVGHDDAIYLDKDEQLRAREMETLAGFEKLCETAKPFVFLNSCSTGQMVRSLGGGSGFPRSFGNLGARAVIAPLWPVSDDLARRIAVRIYEAALAPNAPPVAAILRDLRKHGYEAEDVDTFAAYCFYGDPLARLTLVDA